jgi:hypothetical protein
MRRYLTTALLALVLGGLGAYLYFVELPTARTKDLIETKEKQLLRFEQQDISGLTLETDAGKVVLTRGETGTWKIVSPLKTDADSREVEALIRALLLGKVSRIVQEEPTALGSFGLEKPAVVLTVAAGAQQETISIGDSGPISSTLYAARASDRKVLLTDLAPKDFMNKTLHTFRKKEVLRFEPSRAERLRLTYPTTEIVLYRIGDKKSKKWEIRFPAEGPADQSEIRSLLFKLEDLKALGFIDPGPEYETVTRRLRRPAMKITVHAEGADQNVKLFQLDASSGEAYAITDPDAPIYRISPAMIKGFQKDLFALQDKRLLGLEQDDIATLSVTTREEQYTLIYRIADKEAARPDADSEHGSWTLKDEPTAALNQEAVDMLVSRVVNLPAELRVLKHAGPLAPYGLTSPSAEFTAIARDGKRQGRLVLGNKVNGLIYAIGQAMPGIFQTRSDILMQIPPKKELLSHFTGQGRPAEKPPS